MNPRVWLRWLVLTSICIFFVSCGGSPDGDDLSPEELAQRDLCDCRPEAPVESDYRHAAKHVGLPAPTGADISVETVLGWERGPEPDHRAPRSGREHQMFRIPRAFLQLAWINPGDCDLHLEVSATPDKNAPRIIVETPIESAYCPHRRNIYHQLRDRGFIMNRNSGELAQPAPVEIIGLAFRDYEHPRGSPQVATPWEIHPAIVNVVP